MRKYIFVPLLALMVLFAACGKEESSSVPETTAATRSEATRSEAATAAKTTAAEQTTAAQSETKATGTVPPTTAPATSKPVQDNIPADTITAGHINPNLSGIQGYVMSEISALAVTGISLESDSVTIERGETAEVTVIFEPSYAANKRCTVETDNSCVKATYKSGVLTLIGEKQGDCTVRVTSNNGYSTSCTVTVKPSDKHDAPEETTAAEPTTEPATEASHEEPTE
ncbi:Ig-like domain-containing protein [Ruminococcus sp.]|uniref:Ig-like domain-containing protein n=1 Tax=Ruminococcus sp. TaxID=41978 RepID=UPI002E79EB07|nr:Ig-like domain-containing protein [Ruminococcus sp.]MEE1263488.1 Ig-like domain-containing protein [Ruminococcus sp.]